MQVSVQILVLVDAIDFDRCYSKSILSWMILSLCLRSPKTPLVILLDHSFAIMSYIAYQGVALQWLTTVIHSFIHLFIYSYIYSGGVLSRVLLMFSSVL